MMSRGITRDTGARTRRSLVLFWTALFLFSIVLQYANFIVAPALASAATTGAVAPTATTAPNEWTDPSNAFANDGSYAQARGDNMDQGYTGFGITLPPGSIIDGIAVAVEARASDASGCELEIRLGSGGGLTNADTEGLPGSDTVLNFGGASDTWDRLWDPTEIDDLVVEVRLDDPGNGCNDDNPDDNTATAFVDALTVAVTYRTVDSGTANAALTKGVCETADFNFIVDMSGSIGPQDGRPSNLPALQAGITAFVDAFAAAGGDGIYAGTRFNGTSATNLTSGYVSPSSFKAQIAGLSGPNGTTPTAAGIGTGAANSAGDRPTAPNVMFVVTDGSPNVPGGSLSDPPTWLQAANAAIAAANSARAGGYVVKAVYLSTAGDPGDTTLPFSPAGDAQWAQKVMTEIGGGSYLDADFSNFVNDLFEAIACAPPPVVDLTKSVDDDSKPEPGGTFNYTLAIKNLSSHPVEITELTDDHDLSQECLDLIGDILAPGATVTCDYSVDYSAIGSHPNTASVTVENEDGGTASDTDDATVTVTDLLPDVLLEKSVEPASRPEPGGLFTFTLKITNTSQETFVIDALTDDYPLSAQCLDLIGDSLAPGASTSCTYTVTRTDAGTYNNTADVEVSDDEGNEDSDSDDASFQVTNVAPTISVDKTASPLSRPEPGGQFTFTVEVTNTSDEDVTITSLSDDKFGNLDGKGSCAIGAELEPDETYTCTFPGTFNGNAGASHTNTVTAVAVDDEGSQASDSDDATVSLTDVEPTITVAKTVSQLTRPEPGGSFTFTVVVTNTSAEAVTITSLVDNVHGNLNGKGTCATGAVLAANGGTWSCFFAADFLGNAGDSETDTVTATAVDDDGSTATDSDDATVSLTDVPPTVSVDKTASPTVVDEPGGSVTFTVEVTNTSSEPVTLDSLVDDIHGNLDGQGSCETGGTIAAGATYTCSFSANVTGNAGDFETDVVAAVVSDDDGSEDEDSDDATVTIVNVDPTIRVIKTAVPLTRPEPGGSFQFNVQVINDSNETVTLVSLTDDVYGNLDGEGTCAIGATLAANGGTYSCSFGGSFMGDAGDSQTDIVTATVVDDDETERSNFDDATVSLTDVPPTVEVDKTANPGAVEAGTLVTFTVKVKNTSVETVHLTDLVDSIHGDLDGVGTCVANGSVAIAPGATYTCAFSAIVSKTETDVVTATVEDNDENDASDHDDATVTVVDLTIEKSFTGNSGGTAPDGTPEAKAGDVLTYTLAYDVTNGPLHNGVITDKLPIGLDYVAGSATSNAEFTFQSYNAATRTLTWTAPTVTTDGSVTYKALVLVDSDELPQPLVNITTIDSDETDVDDDRAAAFVETPPQAATATPVRTLPPTDMFDNDGHQGNPGFSLMLLLLALGGLVLVVGFITPVPERVRRRGRRG